jgi:hypothetical protein
MYIEMYIYSIVADPVLEPVTSSMANRALGDIRMRKNGSAPIVADSDSRMVKSDQKLLSL